MALDERSRRLLYQKLEEILGQQEASTLMEHLPQAGWDQIATKDDLFATRDDLQNEIRRLEDRLIARMELTKAELMSHTLRTVLVTNVTSIMTVAGIAFAAARLS
ncbi:MAG: hypothetical protein ACRDH6_07845 [Actinomycetota bacterium]